MIRYHIILDGRVQGVGCRYFCQMNAASLSLTGWVRNLNNGMVELEVQGDEKVVNNYVSLISKGNRFIRIDDYSIKKTELIFTEHSFKITY